MLPWWGWALLWVVLLVWSVLLVGLRVRRAWRSAGGLTAELGRATDTLAALETHADRLREDAAQPGLEVTAVTQDPHGLREEHRRRRAEQAAARSARRAQRLPPWARHVH